MIGVIQMKKPVTESPDYYLSFYNMYNLLQINDAIIFNVFEEALEMVQLSTENLLEKINTDNFAEKLKAMFRCTGVCPPDNLIKMCEENRGADTSFVCDLQSKNINTFDWFRKTNEFVQLYAIFEQALKEFLLQKGCNNISGNVMGKLFEHLTDNFQEF